jgi:glycolate oxidase subunit GlcD
MATEQQIETNDELIDELREIVGPESVLARPEELLVYECDGLPQHKHPPRAVVFPASTEDTSLVLQTLTRRGVSFAPRGAGTGLSGGALAINRGVIIELARMRKILAIDRENRTAVVQTGLVNAQLSRAVAPFGLYYVPDPSSQPSCTIGGNIAENAGGIHCLKYGTTTDHVVGARVVLSDGSIVDLGGHLPGYDLLGVFVGSEGTFGIATEATVRLTRVPPAVRTLLADFADVNDASRAVSAIIAAGILPAALEMMDNEIIRAVEASIFTAGLPVDAGAVLLVELDGVEAGIDGDAEQVDEILRAHAARSVHRATDETERKKLWAARKGAFGAVGRLSPDIMIQDAVVPRSRLPEVLAETYRISAQYKLKLANVFHAGDGNLHPLICFDLRRGDDLERVRQAGREIMEICVRAGGSITGEHGVGLDKSGYLPLIFSEDDMTAMLQVRAAFDESGLCNPGKIIPLPRGCGEARAVATQQVAPETAVSRAAPFSPARPAAVKTAHARLSERINEVRLIKEFKQLVGPPNVKTLGDLDQKPDLQTPDADRALLIAPQNSEQVSQVIELAAAENLCVVPAGSGKWLHAGNAMGRIDVVLDTRALTGLVRHEPADLVATVAAGLRLSQLQKTLAEKGQWLAVDPPDDGTATVGGVVAAGLSGPQALGYGPLRSFVIGMKIVLADGRLIKAGGNVVKNVAGYDLCKLFTGSFGTLGVITEVTFKLRPLPSETRTIVASGARQRLVDAGRRIDVEFFPAAIELLSSSLAEQLGFDRVETLLVRFAGSARTVVTQTAQALKLLRDSGVECSTSENEAALWQLVSASSLRPSCDIVWRASLKPSELNSFIDDVAAPEHDAALANLQWQASLGDGRLRGTARTPVYHQEAVRALKFLRQKSENPGGSLVIDKAPIEIKQELDAWGNLGNGEELMKRIKRQLDPGNMFSPGRFFD